MKPLNYRGPPLVARGWFCFTQPMIKTIQVLVSDFKLRAITNEWRSSPVFFTREDDPSCKTPMEAGSLVAYYDSMVSCHVWFFSVPPPFPLPLRTSTKVHACTTSCRPRQPCPHEAIICFPGIANGGCVPEPEWCVACLHEETYKGGDCSVVYWWFVIITVYW